MLLMGAMIALFVLFVGVKIRVDVISVRGADCAQTFLAREGLRLRVTIHFYYSSYRHYRWS
jgi:hypothetical protein